MKYFTFQHSGAGFTDQLRYFSAMYSLGAFMGYSYMHAPFVSPRSGIGTGKIPSAHEFIGVNAHFQRSGSQIDEALDDFNIVEISLPEIAWSRDRVGLFQVLINDIFDAVTISIEKNNFTNHSILIVFKLYTGSQKKFCQLIFENVDHRLELNELEAIYSNERMLVPHRSSFKEADIKMLLHVRQGDTSILSTPWNTFIPVRFKRKDFLKEYESYSEIERSKIFSTDEVFSFIQGLFGYLKSKNIAMLLFSDGWQRAHKIVYRNIEKMGLSAAKVEQLKASEADYDKHKFQDFSKFENISMHIGEEPEMLLDLIHSAVESDVIVCTSQQNMMPKLVASLCSKNSPKVIILYKNKIPDDSSIVADYKDRFIYVDILNPNFSSWIKKIDFFQ